MWKDNTAPRPMPVPAPAPESKEPVRVDPPKPQYAPVAAAAPVARADTSQPRKESVIAPDLTIEGKIVDLLHTAVVTGDLKAGTLTVAAGARMRGHAEFGWEDGKGGPKAVKYGSGNAGE